MAGEATHQLLLASSRGEMGLLADAIRKGAEVNDTDAHGTTALMHAAAGGFCGAMKLLLGQRALTSLTDAQGSTALHHACAARAEEAVALLLAAKASVEARNALGVDALMQASLGGLAVAAEALLGCRASPDARDGGGATALMRACSRGHAAVVEILLNHQADVNLQASDGGTTALITAARNGHKEIVRALLRRGAATDCVDADGLTALDWATECEHFECAQILQARARGPLLYCNAERLCMRVHMMLQDGSRPEATRAEVGGPPRMPLRCHDVSGDAGVLKVVLRHGKLAGGFPPEGARVRVRYTASVARGAEKEGHRPVQSVDRSMEPFTECALGSGALTRGLDLLVRGMCEGELCRAVVRTDYAYGARGAATPAIPPNVHLEYVLELLSWQVDSRVEGPAVLLEASQLKEEGSRLFRNSSWTEASRKYSTAAALLAPLIAAADPDERREAFTLLQERATCTLNEAQCWLNVNAWEKAEDCCSKVLDRFAAGGAATSPAGVAPAGRSPVETSAMAKALYRRGRARHELGDARGAVEDLRHAARVDSKSKEVRELLQLCIASRKAAAGGEQELASHMIAGAAYEDDRRRDAAAAPEMRVGAPLPAGFEPTDESTRTYFENELAIATAKLEDNMGNLVMSENGKVSLLPPERMGGKCGSYTWGQSERELQIKVPWTKGLQLHDVRLRTTSFTLELCVGGETVLSGNLYARIVSDDSHYIIDEVNGSFTVVVYLTKLVRTHANSHWPCVIKGEPEIDTSKFGNSVIAFDEDREVSAYLQYMKEINATGLHVQ
ncbi:hypothetical protein AB1Y20_010477 [Prymnesium parvum]|uniref:peptidylprolyl isomerase n=1 Tax=Prymnesium parvum TaxID=97485 RepID=A0AB34IPU1_PRYPA